ncbi:MAG TPA: hypothetical protein VND64_30325 [Pirellulales bacterium]|nr:hypothetical protein [Pirellulales bacterium]
MKRFALVTALLCTVLVASASPASARYYRRPVARAARVALPPYGRGYYGPRYYGGYYGRGYYGPRFYGYGPRFGYYGPGAYVGIGVY